MVVPDVNITCVDINTHKYVLPCFNRIKEDYNDVSLIHEGSYAIDDVWFYILRIKNNINCYINNIPYMIKDITNYNFALAIQCNFKDNNTIIFKNTLNKLNELNNNVNNDVNDGLNNDVNNELNNDVNK